MDFSWNPITYQFEATINGEEVGLPDFAIWANGFLAPIIPSSGFEEDIKSLSGLAHSDSRALLYYVNRAYVRHIVKDPASHESELA